MQKRTAEGSMCDVCLVRKADLSNLEDAAALILCLNAYLADPMGGGQPPMGEEAAACVIAGLMKLPTSLVFVACFGAISVGVAVCFEGFSTFSAMPLINIHDLVVVPRARHRGVGGALLKAIEKHAQTSGCCKMTLEVRADNLAAQLLYARFGFSAGSSPMAFWTKRIVPFGPVVHLSR